MGSVNSKVSEDEAYLDLTGSCSGLSLACARLHLSSGQVQEDDHSRSWRVCRLLHPGCRLLRQERQLQQGQRLLEDRKGEVLRGQLPGRDGCRPYPQCALPVEYEKQGRRRR